MYEVIGTFGFHVKFKMTLEVSEGLELETGVPNSSPTFRLLHQLGTNPDSEAAFEKSFIEKLNNTLPDQGNLRFVDKDHKEQAIIEVETKLY